MDRSLDLSFDRVEVDRAEVEREEVEALLVEDWERDWEVEAVEVEVDFKLFWCEEVLVDLECDFEL